MYLSALSSLEASANVKNIVISLIDRFAGYAKRVKEEKSGQDIIASAKLFDVFWEQITELITVFHCFNMIGPF